MHLDGILDLNHGFATRAALHAAGLSRHRLQQELRSGRLVAYGRTIVARPWASAQMRRAVALRTRLACVTAAAAMGLWVLETDAFHVVSRGAKAHVARDPAAASIRVHWNPSPIEADAGRLAIESGRHALAHLADCQPLDAAVATFDSAIRKGLISAQELRLLAARRRGRFAEVVALSSSQSDSGLESIMRVRLRWQGVVCREQHLIDGHHVDLLIGDRLVVQLDGRQHLDDPVQLARDRRQDRRLRLMGYTVLRYGYAEVVHDWATTWAEIRVHLAHLG